MSITHSSAREYLVQHDPAALSAYNVALRMIEQLVQAKITSETNDDQKQAMAVHSQKGQLTNGLP